MADIHQLLRPFSEDETRSRKGKKGLYFKYVPSNIVIDRLNEIGPLNWQFEVKDSKQINNEVVVLGSLKIGKTVKEGYGSAIMDEKRTAGDSFKTASALSLTKAASLFGIPCIFHSNNKDTQQGNDQYCDDCGNAITNAEIQFTKKYLATYNNKRVCRKCQPKYSQNSFRRVQ